MIPKENRRSDFTVTVSLIWRSIASAAFFPFMRDRIAKARESLPFSARYLGDSGTKHTSIVNTAAT